MDEDEKVRQNDSILVSKLKWFQREIDAELERSKVSYKPLKPPARPPLLDEDYGWEYGLYFVAFLIVCGLTYGYFHP